MRKNKRELPARTKAEESRHIKNTITAKNTCLSIAMPMLACLVLFLYRFMRNQMGKELLTDFIALSLFGITFLFVLFVAIYKKGFLYENERYFERFFAVFVVGLLLVVVQAFLPPLLWLFLPLAVMLALFSGLQTGICSYLLLLYLEVLLVKPEPTVFLGFACIGMIGITLFSYLDIEFLFGVPLFTVLLFLYTALLAIDFAQSGSLSFDSFLYAAINLFISFLMLTFSLKYLSYKVLHKDRDKYQEINDPEFILLTQLKEQSVRAYYHAIHTAYFSEKIARRIGANEMLAKAGGYYHKIGKMRGDNNLKNALDIAGEYAFPAPLVQLLKEYGGKNTILRSKEAAIVLLADAMVSSVMFLFEKDKNASLHYEQIVHVIFKKQMDSGILNQCSLTLDELTTVRQIFVEETLYYDFLR